MSVFEDVQYLYMHEGMYELHRKLLLQHLRDVVSAVAIEYTAHGQRLQWLGRA